MNIAVDLRSLQSGSISGVENYTLNLLDALLAMDKQNRYTLFYNSFRNSQVGDMQYINSKLVKTRYPNRLLNLALMMKLAGLEKITGDFDVLFMPNLNQFNIRPGAKLAMTVHDLSPVVTPEFYDLKRNVWHKLLSYSAAFKRANIIFAVSEYTKLDLMRLFNVPAEKIRVIYPGIDTNIFRPDIGDERLRRIRNTYGLPGDYILFLNTIEPRKNLSGLLKAYESLDSRADLVIVGRQGWKYKRIFDEIKHSRKSSKIRYMGYLAEADKPAVIKLSRMLVYPSFYEGFGFQPLEAMAIGTPTIVSQVTALPEIVGSASLLVNPYSTDDIRRAMQALLTDQLLRAQFISKGFAQARKYNWQRTAEQVLQGLNNIS